MHLSKLTLIIAVMTSLAISGQTENSTVFNSREEIPAKYKWDLTRFYSGWEAWEMDLKSIEAGYDHIATYEGRLSEGPDTLLEVLKLQEAAGKIAIKAFGYAFQSRDLDTRDNAVRVRMGELMDVYSRSRTKLSWISPELLKIPESMMREWIEENPELEPYRFGIMDTYRTGDYILNEEGERLINLHGRVRNAPGDIYSSLTNADGDRPEVELEDGTVVKVTPGIYSKALVSYSNPVDRRNVQAAWMEQFEDRRNTFASIYNGVLQQGWTLAQSRGYPSTLALELDDNNIPEAVLDSLVKATRSGAEELQRYHRLRKEYMALDRYGWSDMHIPLIQSKTNYQYDDIIPLIVDAVGVLGEEYQGKMVEQFSSGFIDVYETPGKRSGAYNTSRYGVGSFVFLNYQGTLEDVFTVAHEMGHSMHSRLAQDYQPFPTHRYTIFVAEVASILTEKLLLRKLLQEVDEPRERIAFLESQIEKIKSTFFTQTMMADFEWQAHQLVESGEGISADRLTELWKGTVSAYLGDIIPEDDPYMLSWARIPHLYNSPYYVYQYATCYASAAELMNQMETDDGTIDRYLGLLKSGGNAYPMDQLRDAGVDLSSPEAFQAVIVEFRRLVDELEEEYTRYLDKNKPIG